MTRPNKYVVIDTDLPEGKNIIYEIEDFRDRHLILKQECDRCLHGWLHDVVQSIDENGNENTCDEPCGRCDGTGFI